MRIYIRYALYLTVLLGFSYSRAGSYDDFFEAIQRDNPAVVRALLKRGFDSNTISPKGEYGLMLAIREPSFQVVDVLLEHSLTQVEVRNAHDESPLMLAALKGYLEICKKLIARDADVNKPGWTPLHYAATGGHVAVVTFLLENHAYIDAASPNGSTPLMMAARYGTIDAVKVLLTAGADPGVKNAVGLTAVDFAREVQREDMVALIAGAVRSQRPTGTW